MAAEVPVLTSVDFLNQTTALTAATVFTLPASDGMYLVSVYGPTVVSGSGYVNGTWNWTDENNVSQQSQIDQTRPIYAKGGTAITVTTTISSGSPTYNLRFRIESV